MAIANIFGFLRAFVKTSDPSYRSCQTHQVRPGLLSTVQATECASTRRAPGRLAMGVAAPIAPGTPVVVRRTRCRTGPEYPEVVSTLLLVVPPCGAQRFEPLDFGFHVLGFEVEVHPFLAALLVGRVR